MKAKTTKSKSTAKSTPAVKTKSTAKSAPLESRKNLTRFTYETQAFEGWRLCLGKKGTTFTRYFPDKKFGGGKESLAAAEATLKELKALLDAAKLVDGKLPASTIKKAQKLLKDAV
jgi:hypothetical protein